MINQIKIMLDDGVPFGNEKHLVLYDYVGNKTLTYRIKLADLTPAVFELHLKAFDIKIDTAKASEK